MRSILLARNAPCCYEIPLRARNAHVIGLYYVRVTRGEHVTRYVPHVTRYVVYPRRDVQRLRDSRGLGTVWTHYTKQKKNVTFPVIVGLVDYCHQETTPPAIHIPY